MKILITGGAGFIGFHLAKRLLEDDNTVIIADNFSRGVEDRSLIDLSADKKVELIPIDLLNKKSFNMLDKDFDVIFHLAAIIGVQHVLSRPYDVLRDNVELLLNMIEFARQQTNLNRFVFTSTSEVYAGTLNYFNMEIPTPENTPLTISSLDNPRTSYMLSKIYGEALLKQSSVPFTIIRPHNFFGPRMGMSHVIPELLKKAYFSEKKAQIDVFSTDHKRTFCYISDAVEYIYRLILCKESLNETFNIGNQEPEVSIKELAESVFEIVGKNQTINPMPATEGSPARRAPNTKKLVETTKYCSQVTLKEGIKNTYDWYIENVFESDEVSAN